MSDVEWMTHSNNTLQRPIQLIDIRKDVLETLLPPLSVSKVCFSFTATIEARVGDEQLRFLQVAIRAAARRMTSRPLEPELVVGWLLTLCRICVLECGVDAVEWFEGVAFLGTEREGSVDLTRNDGVKGIDRIQDACMSLVNGNGSKLQVHD